ncbi:hypothetical protein JX266_000872 [Neoarthrinium moseri]|nr:hypothetical protein JX266_000872 [Neoarthrinium moseri]
MHTHSLLATTFTLLGLTTSATIPPRTTHASQTLRIWPLGDSITFGTSSTDGNGYRKDLRDLLTKASLQVDFVGSQKSDSMDDGDNDGHPGYTIQQLSPYPAKIAEQKPDVVLLMAGTNDIGKNTPDELALAPKRLGELVDWIFGNVTDTSVIVAQITPFVHDSAKDKKAIEYNKGVKKVIEDRSAQGKKITLVDMHSALKTDDFGPNDIHPNDGGYRKMANVWFKGVKKVVNKGCASQKQRE